MSQNVWYIPAKRTDPGMNVGIYCRVSTSEKNQLNSLAAQIAALTRAVANVEQWKLTDTFIDIASAKGESPRREFERMIRAAGFTQTKVEPILGGLVAIHSGWKV